MNAGNKNTPSMNAPTKTECDYLNGWIKNSHICKNLTQNGEAQRYDWEHRKKKNLTTMQELREQISHDSHLTYASA